MIEHYENRGNPNSFAGKYNCFILIYFEQFPNVLAAIDREKVIKKMSRARKEAMINKNNKHWEEIIL